MNPHRNHLSFIAPYTDISFDSVVNEIIVILDLPGVSKSTVKTTVRQDDIIVFASSRIRNYKRRLIIRNPFRQKEIHARFKNGVLELRIPLKYSTRKDQIFVTLM